MMPPEQRIGSGHPPLAAAHHALRRSTAPGGAAGSPPRIRRPPAFLRGRAIRLFVLDIQILLTADLCP